MTDENESNQATGQFEVLQKYVFRITDLVKVLRKEMKTFLQNHQGSAEPGRFSTVWFEGIGEYRIDWGPGYRIYLAQDGLDLIILFGGGTKKAQQTDINKAKLLYFEYKDRKKKERGKSKDRALKSREQLE
jgi:putative addiction module killer protein